MTLKIWLCRAKRERKAKISLHETWLHAKGKLEAKLLVFPGALMERLQYLYIS